MLLKVRRNICTIFFSTGLVTSNYQIAFLQHSEIWNEFFTQLTYCCSLLLVATLLTVILFKSHSIWLLFYIEYPLSSCERDFYVNCDFAQRTRKVLMVIVVIFCNKKMCQKLEIFRFTFWFVEQINPFWVLRFTMKHEKMVHPSASKGWSLTSNCRKILILPTTTTKE